MWDLLKQQAKKATEFSEHYTANHAFVEQLLAHPGEQALNRLQAKISQLDDQAYQELAATLVLMYATEQQNLQLLKSTDGFGEGFDAELWRIQAPTEPRQQFVLNRMQALEALIGFAQVFRMQSPSSDKNHHLAQSSEEDEYFQTTGGVVNHFHHTHNPSRSAGIKRKTMKKRNSETVLLGVSSPRQVTAETSFSAHFVAYIESEKKRVERTLKGLGDQEKDRALDIPPKHESWKIGAPVRVRVSGEYLNATPAEDCFEWNGRMNLLSFLVDIKKDAPETVLLCFDVFIGNINMAHIPIKIAISSKVVNSAPVKTEISSFSSAFASYSSKDKDDVLKDLSFLSHWAPNIDVFQDCLDLKANEAFKPQLATEISRRDIFLLFWSRNARSSPWVLWELDTARKKPSGLDAICPVPLEDIKINPPPPGFEDRHLRDRFMIARHGLEKIEELAKEELSPCRPE